MPETFELIVRRLVAEFGLVAERKQGLGASGGLPGARDLQYLLVRQVDVLVGTRRMRKRTIVANIPTEFGERNENLRE